MEYVEQLALLFLRQLEKIELEPRHPVEQTGVDPTRLVLAVGDLGQLGGLRPALVRHVHEALLQLAAPLAVNVRVAGRRERLQLGVRCGSATSWGYRYIDARRGWDSMLEVAISSTLEFGTKYPQGGNIVWWSHVGVIVAVDETVLPDGATKGIVDVPLYGIVGPLAPDVGMPSAQPVGPGGH